MNFDKPLHDMSFNDKFKLLQSDKTFVYKKKSDKIAKSYGKIGDKAASLISHIPKPIPGSQREKIKTGKQARQIVANSCKTELKLIDQYLNDPDNGYKKEYEDLKKASPEEFPKKLKALTEKINNIQEEVLVCLDDLVSHAHLLADAGDSKEIQDLIKSLHEIKDLHANLTKINTITDFIKEDGPTGIFAARNYIVSLADENTQLFEEFGSAINGLIQNEIRPNPSKYEAYSYKGIIDNLKEIAAYCGAADSKKFIAECGITPPGHEQILQNLKNEAEEIFQDIDLPTNTEETPVEGLVTNVLKGIKEAVDDIFNFDFSGWVNPLAGFEERIIPEEKPKISEAEIKSLENSSKTFAQMMQNATDKTNIEKVCQDTVQELGKNIGQSPGDIQTRLQEITSLNEALGSIQTNFPSPVLAQAKANLNQLGSALQLREKLITLSDQIRAKTGVVEDLVYTGPEIVELQPLEQGFTPPPRTRIAAELVLSRAIKTPTDYLIFNDLSKKLDKTRREQAEICLNEIRKPPPIKTKEWYTARIKDMEDFASFAITKKKDGTTGIRYEVIPLQNYKAQLENELALLKAAENNVKLENQLFSEIKGIFPEFIPDVEGSIETKLEMMVDSIINSPIPQDVEGFTKKIQDARAQIFNIASQITPLPLHYQEMFNALTLKEQAIYESKLTVPERQIKDRLGGIQNVQKASSLDEFQQLNQQAIRAMTDSLVSIPKEEQTAAGFRARVILMQEVFNHFSTVPGVEHELRGLQGALNNYKGAAEALEVLEGKKTTPAQIKADPNSPTFQLVQVDIVTQKAFEQFKKYQEILSTIQPPIPITPASIEKFKEASLIAKSLLTTCFELGGFVYESEDLGTLILQTHQEFQHEFIGQTLSDLTLTPDELIAGLSTLHQILPGNFLTEQDVFVQLVNQTLENTKETTPLETLTKQRDLLAACVNQGLGGTIISDKLANYNELIKKFSEGPVATLQFIQEKSTNYSRETLNAVYHEVNHLLENIQANAGDNPQKLQAALTLLGEIHAAITIPELQTLKTASLEIKTHLEKAESAINNLFSAKAAFDNAPTSSHKLLLADQFCNQLMESGEALSRFPALSERVGTEFSSTIHESFKEVKNLIRREFQSYTGNSLNLQTSEQMFNLANNYADRYARLITILPDASKELAIAELKELSQDVQNVQKKIGENQAKIAKRESMLELHLNELNEELAELKIPQALEEKIEELMGHYEAALGEKGLPQGLSLPVGSHLDNPASLLTDESLRTSCNEKIKDLQEDIRQTNFAIKTSEETIAGLQKQKAKLEEPYDVRTSVKTVLESHGLKSDDAGQSQEYFETKYAAMKKEWEESQDTFSPAGGFFATLINPVQELIAGQTNKQDELASLQKTYGKNVPNELLAIGTIIDTLSRTKKHENNNLNPIAEVSAKIANETEKLKRLQTFNVKDEQELAKLNHLNEAIKLGISEHENGQSVIEAFQRHQANRSELEDSITETQDMLKSTSDAQKILSTALDQSFVMGRWDGAKGAADVVHTFIQVFEKAASDPEVQLHAYNQIQNIEKVFGNDPIFQQLIVPYKNQLNAIHQQFNP